MKNARFAGRNVRSRPKLTCAHRRRTRVLTPGGHCSCDATHAICYSRNSPTTGHCSAPALTCTGANKLPAQTRQGRRAGSASAGRAAWWCPARCLSMSGSRLRLWTTFAGIRPYWTHATLRSRRARITDRHVVASACPRTDHKNKDTQAPCLGPFSQRKARPVPRLCGCDRPRSSRIRCSG
jgi:hypothetical protein